MIERFNEVSNWVASEIVKQPQLFHRVVIIEKFIEVAQELQRLHNLNGLTAVIGGLNSSPVSRLKRTWAKVKPQGKLPFFVHRPQGLIFSLSFPH